MSTALGGLADAPLVVVGSVVMGVVACVALDAADVALELHPVLIAMSTSSATAMPGRA
jgi:hypothetical protein